MILLTGATGYIGSHIWIELLKASKQVIGLDNLSNSHADNLKAISLISGVNPIFIRGDIRDLSLLEQIFSDYQIASVIHLAALKNVEESMCNESEYFDVNVRGLQQLTQVMRKHGCRKIIFSSSAAVYGPNATSPIVEIEKLSPSSIYGATKQQGEQILEKEFNFWPPLSSISLRYFNVAGKHSSGLLDGYGHPASNSLFSSIEAVIRGNSGEFLVFGNDWNTPDGTCIRDYVHVSDVARGHIAALDVFHNTSKACMKLNLGLGIGRSVLEVLTFYEQVIGKKIPKSVVSRRKGDIGVSYADTKLAVNLLGWSPKNGLKEMCIDSYRACNANLKSTSLDLI